MFSEVWFSHFSGEYFLYVEFSDFYVNQSLAGQTIHVFRSLVFSFFGRGRSFQYVSVMSER
jgi:hypothetical protein